MEMKYKLIYANRKTVSIRIDENGALMVRAPYFTSKNEIEKIFLELKDEYKIKPVVSKNDFTIVKQKIYKP